MKRFDLRILGLVLSGGLLGFACGPLHGQAPSIKVGLSLPLTGPNAAYGQGLRHGVLLAIARANAQGGVGGKQLEALVLDDAGEPRRAADNAKQLLQQGVVALTGVHGAEATKAVSEVLLSANGDPVAALVAPSTSADVLRVPPHPAVFHLRAGASEEVSAGVLHFDTLGLTRYAVLAQDDALGESGAESVMQELLRIGMRPVATKRLTTAQIRSELNVTLKEICALQPEAIIVALNAEGASAAITEARARQCGGQYLVLSETGAALALRHAGTAGPHPLAPLIVTQVVPNPNNLSNPLVHEYQRARAQEQGGAASYPSLEGYLAMRVIQEALRACSKDVSRTCLLHAMATRSFELPGLRVQFGTAHRQVRPFVEMTLLDKAGRFRR